MGRPKKFDPDIVLDKAMALFHRKGFNATKTDEIVNHLGINKFSIYKEFGSNKALFYRALLRYYEKRFNKNFGTLSMPTASIEELRMFFTSLPEKLERNNHGCMLCNATVEFGELDDKITQKLTDNYLKEIPAAFKNALDNAKRDMLLVEYIDTDVVANLLAAIFLGLMVQVRGNVAILLISASCDGAIQYLNTITKKSTP